MISWAKSKPGQLSYASFSPGTPSHFLGHQLNLRFGLDLAHLPYRGAAPQSNDLVAGHALLGFTQLGVAAPLAGSGKLKAIATTGLARSRLLPDVPTFAELRHPEFNTSIWFGLLVKAGTPPDLVDKLTVAAKAAHADAQIKAKLEKMGFDVPGRTGAHLLPEIKAQIARWAALVKASGFSAD
jgi:tripartite-type tricarboxylate transporter receptor subunit TctC